MLSILAVWVFIILLTGYILKWYFVRLVCHWCANRFQCKQVCLNEISWFSMAVSQIKVIVTPNLTIELDGCRVRSSLFNSEHSKLITVYVSDIRIELAPDALQTHNTPQTQTTGPTPHCPSAPSSNTRSVRALFWLQYISVNVGTARLICIDLPSTGCICHVSFEHLTFDTFRDHAQLNMEFGCKMVSVKVMRRSVAFGAGTGPKDTPSTSNEASPHMVSVSVRVLCVLTVNMHDALPLKTHTLLTQPVLQITEGALWFIKSRTGMDGTKQSSHAGNQLHPNTQPAAASSSKLKQLLSSINTNLECENVVLRFVAANRRVSELAMRGLDMHSEGTSGRLEWAVMDVQLVDGLASNMQLSALTCYTANTTCMDGEDMSTGCVGWSCAVHADEPVATVAETDVLWWAQFIRSMTQTSMVSLELSSVCCVIVPMDGPSIQLGVSLVSITGKERLTKLELAVEWLWCYRYEQGHPHTSPNQVPFEIHTWGTPLLVGAALVQVTRCAEDWQSVNVQCHVVDIRVEWDVHFVQQLVAILVMLHTPGSYKQSPHGETPKPTTNWQVAQITVDVQRCMLLLPVLEKVFLSAQFARLHCEQKDGQRTVHVTGLAVHRDTINGVQLDVSSSEFAHECLCVQNVLLVQIIECKDCVLELQSPASVVWSAETHLAILHCVKSTKHHWHTLRDVYSPIRAHPVLVNDTTVLNPVPAQVQPSVPGVRMAFSSEHNVSVQIQLSHGHHMQLSAPQLRVQSLPDSLQVDCPQLYWACDSQRVCSVQDLCIQRVGDCAPAKELRVNDGTLITPNNRTWLITAKQLLLWFPYAYDFAACYDQAVNSYKLLKVQHEYIKRAFTEHSPLPPDLVFQFEEAILQLDDDPFEVKLRDNYELLMDEYHECERRRLLLEERLTAIQRTNPMLPRGKIAEMYTALAAKNASIYIQRRQQMPVPRSSLFTWTMHSFDLRLVADQSLHGTQHCTQLMALYNPQCVLPPDMTFSTLWARAVEFNVDVCTMHFRDYPQPYMHIQDAHFWGKLLGAEQSPVDRSIRQCAVPLALPWATQLVHRNMNPLKFYYDLSSDIGQWQIVYGPCWEPCLTMTSQCWNRVSAPSKDPSLPLPFWDKIRQRWHGRLSMACERVTTSMLASLDPYNNTEQLELSWDKFSWDWTSGLFLIKADVDAFVRTASKYDDIRLLHLPALAMSMRCNWLCLGDPHDHVAIVPCAPDRLPEFSLNQEHDSYRSFRSRNVDLQWQFEVKTPNSTSDSASPQVLLYSNTLRWLASLGHTLTTKNKPVRRGVLFGTERAPRVQLSRHYKNMHLNVSLPRFLISCWMSFSSNYGFRLNSNGLQWSCALRLVPAAVPVPAKTGPNTTLAGVEGDRDRVQEDSAAVKRRSVVVWTVQHMTADLAYSHIHLFGQHTQTDTQEHLHQTFLPHPSESFFIGLDQLSYTRDNAVAGQTDSACALHRLVVRCLRAAFTAANRDTVLAMFDSLQKSTVLRRNLSNDALKLFEFVQDAANKKQPSSASTSAQADTGTGTGHKRVQSIDGADMLQRLIDEQNTKLIAYSEEVLHEPVEFLNGVALCSADDVLQIKWQIELVNSQMCLKGIGSERGLVLCTAARADVCQRMHSAVWREGQLLAKNSWVATLSGMQYYAPPFDSASMTMPGTGTAVGLGGSTPTGSGQHKDRGLDRERDTGLYWLPSAHIEQPLPNTDHDQVGGVLTDVMDGEYGMGSTVHMQRVISRCACQLYFCYYNDALHTEEHQQHIQPVQQREDNDTESESTRVGARMQHVDTFTLKHNMLEVCTNTQQYHMILNIINQLLLYVDPKKKEAAEKVQRLRFQLQPKSWEELRPIILRQQNDVRMLSASLRAHDRRAYYMSRQLAGTDTDTGQALSDGSSCNQSELVQLESQIDVIKEQLYEKSEQLARYISCFKEKQLRHEKRYPLNDEQLAAVARRFEVCFEDCTWRLTQKDGQIGIAQLHIRNFLYTRISRINNSGEHLLEIGNIKVTNLMPQCKYRDVLQTWHEHTGVQVERQLCVRVVCRDMAPVGGISVKDHFEINVSPMVVGITYAFFRSIMKFFFPDRNIDKADQQNLDMSDETQQVQKTPKSEKKVAKSSKKSSRNTQEVDEIDKMKERAEQNIMFLYIKIPEVPFTVSYKGSKEKNIEDVESFNLIFPLVEYHDRNWTWLDLALAIKQRCKRVLLQQFMKQKLLRNRLHGVNERRVQSNAMGEQQKIRVALGNIAISATSEKSSKSGH